MEWLGSFLLYTIPWWLQALFLLVVIGVPILLVAMIIWGPKAVLRLLLPVLGAILTLGLASRFRQQGYADHRAEQEKALDKAEDFVDDKREEIGKLPDTKLDERFDKWSKPPR